MSALSKLGEARIDDAIASGELRPPPPGTEVDLESYFRMPAEWRSVLTLLQGNGFVPPEVELLRQKAKLEEQLADCRDPRERITLRQRLAELDVSYRMAMERMRIKNPS